jgi:hypothetical protein
MKNLSPEPYRIYPVIDLSGATSKTRLQLGYLNAIVARIQHRSSSSPTAKSGGFPWRRQKFTIPLDATVLQLALESVRLEENSWIAA